MFDSIAVSVVLTAVFAVTGGYALLRWASLRAAVGRGGDEVAELAHLLMSLAMIAMTWGYATPATDVVQLVLFGVLGGYFLLRLTTDRFARSGCACPAPGFHLLMCGAMFWMVLAMPWLMTGATTSGDQDSMQMDGMDMPMPEHTHGGADPAPTLAVPVTVLIAVALVAAAGYWGHRLMRLRPAATSPAGPATVTATDPGALAVATRRPHRRSVADRLLARLSPRADVLCHLLMSLAMAATSLLMI